MEKSDLIKKIVDNFQYGIGYMKQIMKLQRNFVPKQITKAQLEIIIFLIDEGECNMKQISEATFNPNSNLTPLIDKLVDIEYVKRSTDINDRRIVTISLTDKGRTFVEEWKSAFGQNMKSNMADFSMDKLETMNKILENMKKFVELE